jgi:hypothetical protein
MAATALPGIPAAGQAAGGDMLTFWAEATGRRRVAGHGLGGLRFAFYGRVSTEDWQDPVTSRARQRDQAAGLVAGHGRIVAEFFDTGYSRTLAWARRPRAGDRRPRPETPGSERHPVLSPAPGLYVRDIVPT